MPIIAIFSGVHSAGEEIARRVANRLKYRFVGEDLLEEVAQIYGNSVEKLAHSMGKPVFLKSIAHEWERRTRGRTALVSRELAK